MGWGRKSYLEPAEDRMFLFQILLKDGRREMNPRFYDFVSYG